MDKLYVVGIGRGNAENLTIRADEALRSCDVIVGYQVYVELVRGRYPDKKFLTTGMTREVERCQLALRLAADGKKTAIICSGDSGVYGMAALIYELRGSSSLPEIEVIPGLTAACSGAALLGAPLTHDFAVISLSDRLTAWETIEQRLDAAAKADLAVVLYNPASRGRPDHLRRACDILPVSYTHLLFFFDQDTLCFLLAKNASGCDVSIIEGVMGYYCLLYTSRCV